MLYALAIVLTLQGEPVELKASFESRDACAAKATELAKLVPSHQDVLCIPRKPRKVRS
jgi:hypothetical protein